MHVGSFKVEWLEFFSRETETKGNKVFLYSTINSQLEFSTPAYGVVYTTRIEHQDKNVVLGWILNLARAAPMGQQRLRTEPSEFGTSALQANNHINK